MTRRIALTFLFLSCIVLSFAQTANFTASVTSSCSPVIVNFQDQSTGNPTSWFWDFGNGATANIQNPSTTYFIPGIYTVKLTVTNAQGNSNTLTRTQYITIYGKPSVNFAVSDSVGCFPLRSQFTDLSGASAGTTNSSWLWDFGDGNQSTQKNPLHVYTTSGNYTVTVKVTNDKGCYAVLTRQSYIKIAGGVKADFTNSQPTTCKPPFKISFANTSTGPGALTWFWDFGDGQTSALQNPVHTYTSTGNYIITLAATSSGGCSDTLRKTNALNIQNINTKFTAPDSICTNSNINFLNTSTPQPVSSVWNFGDGTSSTIINPVKAYSGAATYNITLYNTYSYCTDSFSKKIKILRRPVANFTANTTFKCQPSLAVNFTDQSSNAVSWLWNFGDGSTSTAQNPSHTYNAYGSFDVKLIVTNSSGCTDTLIKPAYIKIIRPTISFPSLPVGGCIPFTINPTANISTLDAVTSYLWDFGNGVTSTSATPSYTYTIQGTYTVKLTITTSSGCTETYALGAAVTVGRVPVINFKATPNPVCALQPVQFTDLTNEGDTWLWNFGDGSTSVAQNPVHQYGDTGLLNVTLTVINNGCKNSRTVDSFITVKPPIAKFGYLPDCGNRLKFTFLDSSVGDTRRLWDFGDGTTDTSKNPVHVFPAYNTYPVSLTVWNDTCSNTTTQQIKVITEGPDFRATATELCRIGQLQLISSTTNPANIVDYYWDEGNGVSVSGAGFTVVNATYVNSGFYTVTLVTTDIYGCRDTVTKPNYIHITGPTAAFNAVNNAGCKGLTATFNDLSNSDGTSKITKWRWDFGDGSVQSFSSSPFQHRYVNAGIYTVKLVVTDASGCTDSTTVVNAVITTEPKASFYSADTLSCPGATVQFTDQSNAINYTSLWNFGNGNTSTATSPSTVYADTGFYTVKLKITDQYGCSDSMIRSNYIKVSKPVARYSVNDSVSSCTPFEVDFTNTSQYYTSSLWNLGGGMSTNQNPVQFYNTPGIYPIELIVTSPGGCRDTTYGTVHVYDTIGSKITYSPLQGCKPLTVGLNAFSKGPMTFTWDFGDGVLITNDSINLNHIYNFFGNFVPKVIMTDPAGCIIPVSGIDTIRIKGAIVKFGLDKKFFCDSGLVNFIDSTTFNDSLTVYNWDFGDGAISHLQNPSHYYNNPGLYTPSLNVQTQNACVDTFKIINGIKIVQSPLISITGDSVICVNDSIQHFGIFNRLDTSAVRWTWTFPNGNFSVLQTPLPQQYIVAGNFVVNTIATNSSGCRDTATQNILVNPLPVIKMPATLMMQAGFPVLIPATYSSNVVSWNWTPTTRLDCSTCAQPVASPKFNTAYTVSVVDSNGCKNLSTVQVIVFCNNNNVFIPNTFSPNGDGSNDIFYVRGKGLERVKSLRIFNRWGQIVFEQQNFPVNDPAYGWNGNFRGNKPVPDVYVYQVEVFCDNSQIVHFEGNVALIQ